MRDTVPVDTNGLPDECPKCDSDDLCICNDDGMECMKCGCWFNTDDDGKLLWAYASHPIDAFL